MFYGNTSLTNINNSCVTVSKFTIVLLFVVAVTKGPKKKMLEEEERDLMESHLNSSVTGQQGAVCQWQDVFLSLFQVNES